MVDSSKEEHSDPYGFPHKEDLEDDLAVAEWKAKVEAKFPELVAYRSGQILAPKNRRPPKERKRKEMQIQLDQTKRKEMQIQQHEASKRQKGKVSGEEVQAEIMNRIEQVTNAIMRSTVELVKSTQRLPIPENEIWNNVVELNLDRTYKMRAYIFLIKNPDMLGALLGCPLEERKELLMNMISH